MALFTALKNKFSPPLTEAPRNDSISDNTAPKTDNSRNEPGDLKTPGEPGIAERSPTGSFSNDEVPSEDVQDGVRQIEALTLVWTKKSLACAYIL